VVVLFFDKRGACALQALPLAGGMFLCLLERLGCHQDRFHLIDAGGEGSRVVLELGETRKDRNHHACGWTMRGGIRQALWEHSNGENEVGEEGNK